MSSTTGNLLDFGQRFQVLTTLSKPFISEILYTIIFKQQNCVVISTGYSYDPIVDIVIRTNILITATLVIPPK